MKVQYSPGIDPLRKEHNGFTFQKSRTYDCVTSSKKNDRARQLRQINRKSNLMASVSHWRNLSPAEQNVWNDFAAAFPQPCHNTVSGFLSGFECFIKRQSYLFLNYGIAANYMVSPLMSEVPNISSDFTVKLVNGRLIVSPTFSTFDNSVIFSIFCSFPCSAGIHYQKSQSRYMGFVSNIQGITPEWGCLYRQNVTTDPRNAAPVGYHFPTKAEFETLIANTGGSAVSAGNLKDTNLKYWASPNVGATNLYGFNARAVGECRPAFQQFMYSTRIWSVSKASFTNFWELQIFFYTAAIDLNQTNPFYGQAIRCIKDDSDLPANMVGNDGTVYPVTKIGDQVWQALPSIESKYRNGDEITLISDTTTWGATSYPARRYPQDNINYAFSGTINELDITDEYIRNFGLLPKVGQSILFKAVPYARENGQFFPDILLYLKVQ